MTTTATSYTGYAASVQLTCTVNGLAQSATVGRQCTVTTNVGNRYVDGLVTIVVPTGTGTTGVGSGARAAYVYFFGSEDGVVFDGDDAQPGVSDAGYTINAASNLKGPVVISCPTGTKVYYKTIPLKSVFREIPRVWGYVLCQDIMPTLGTSTALPSFTGIVDKFEQ
jgi:hypothetical protein